MIRNPRHSNDEEQALADVQGILHTISEAWVGDTLVLRKVLAAALANGHVAFEDDPGLGKTLIVKAFGRAIGCKATRLQFTPDLLPADVTGTKIWDPTTHGFRTVRGPIFTNVLLADEINRAPPRTQSALLEAMSDRQVTIEGETIPLESPFVVLATLNPLEEEGTYPLPIAQWDRFVLRLSLGYPKTAEDELEILNRRLQWKADDPTPRLQAAVQPSDFLHLMEMTENVFVHPDILEWITEIVRRTRERPELEAGPSPRGALALLRVARGMAVVAGRSFVVPDDVRTIAVDALAHRVLLTAEAEARGIDARSVVGGVLEETTEPASGPAAIKDFAVAEEPSAHHEPAEAGILQPPVWSSTGPARATG